VVTRFLLPAATFPSLVVRADTSTAAPGVIVWTASGVWLEFTPFFFSHRE